MDNIYNIVSDMDVPVGMTKRELVPTVGEDIHSDKQHGFACVELLSCILCVKGGTRVRMSADDIRAGFAGADEFAKQDTFKLPDYIVPHDWNVAEIAWELYELDAEDSLA